MSAQLERVESQAQHANGSPQPSSQGIPTKEKSAKRPPDDYSDDTVALRFSDERLRGNARWSEAEKKWRFWDDTRWVTDDRLRIMTSIRAFLRDIANTESPKNPEKLKSAVTCAAVERTARSNPDVASSADVWDSNRWLLGTPGGTVEQRSGKLRSARRDEYITKQVATAPAETADCPLWLAFLARIFRLNPEIVPFLQRVLGYALTGLTTEHKLLFAFGTGRNGKGVFFNTVAGIFGDYAAVAASTTFLESGADAHPTGLAGLEGARLVTADEVTPGKPWNEPVIKSITGGGPITARRMRQDFRTYEPQFMLMISGNHLPTFRGIDEATRSRIFLIPFAETIPKEERDPYLSDKLRAEWPAILRWMIDGCLEWQRIGLQPPEVVTNASQEYLDEEDEFGDFLAEILRAQPGGFVYNKDLYPLFRNWQLSRGVSKPWTQKALTRALHERGLEIDRKSDGRGIKGYSINQLTAADYRAASGGF